MSTFRDDAGKSRILLVDDHQLVRYALRKLIDQTPDLEVVGEAPETNSGWRLIEEKHPDLVVTDISLDGDNGIELVEQIKGKYSRMKVLVLSMHDEEVFAGRSLRAGAHGYINKQESMPAIIEAIRQILRGEIHLSPKMANRLLHRAAAGAPLDDSPIDCLSNRELEVFELLGHGFTTNQIARKLQLSPKTVETHRKNLKTKLNLKNSVQLSRCAFQWVLENRTTGTGRQNELSPEPAAVEDKG